MLSKVIRQGSQNLCKVASRGVYTDATRPHVFINKHTRVLVQGMTGKHVSFAVFKDKISGCRVPTTLRPPWTTAPRSSVESTRERLALLILVFQSTDLLPRPRPRPVLRLLSFTCHLHSLLRPSLRPSSLRSSLWSASPKVFQPST